MIHIRNAEGLAVCGAAVAAGDGLTLGSRQASCDACRSALLIAPVKDMPVRPLPDYEPEPGTGIEPLEEIRARRDGR